MTFLQSLIKRLSPKKSAALALESLPQVGDELPCGQGCSVIVREYDPVQKGRHLSEYPLFLKGPEEMTAAVAGRTGGKILSDGTAMIGSLPGEGEGAAYEIGALKNEMKAYHNLDLPVEAILNAVFAPRQPQAVAAGQAARAR